MPDIPVLATQIAVLFLSLSIHESAHAYAAWRFGDPTAKLLGRITLNPIKHIDLFGSILLPAILIISRSPVVFGWAKPVPVNTLNFRNRLRDYAWVSLAGPLSNLALLVFSSLLLKIIVVLNNSSLYELLLRKDPLCFIFTNLVVVNGVLFLFNLIPLPPLDGSSVLAGFIWPKYEKYIERLGGFSFILLFAIIYIDRQTFNVFNLALNGFISLILSWI